MAFDPARAVQGQGPCEPLLAAETLVLRHSEGGRPAEEASHMAGQAATMPAFQCPAMAPSPRPGHP